MTHAGIFAALGAGRVATDIGHSLREGFSMFWDTLWALVLGFAFSGAVQAFASRQAMQRRLGDHRPGSVTRASLYGMASSSCSYAASAMARSLVAQGADFLAAMVFMFASTNLVIELGIVLVVLIGWQFLAAEFVGAIIMIALLVAVGGIWFRGRALEQARRRAGESQASDHQAAQPDPAGSRIRTAAGWADAASYTMSDLRMLRKEIFIGFAAAGFLATLVPTSFWNDLFFHGHGFWTNLENALIGPFVAIISFVCSVGNVPLAAALWKGGIGFGGVVSFVFADLITLPLLLIYRKQYGGRMTLRMLTLFWAVMAAAGLATQYLFDALGWLPTARPTVIAHNAVGLNYITVLDVVALSAFAVLYWLYRHRDRLGGGHGYAKDPVCGMQVHVAKVTAQREHNGATVYFCSEHCADRFDRDHHTATSPREQPGSARVAIDPICGGARNG